MNISILSVFPDLYTPFLNTSLVARAQKEGVISVSTQSFFDYAQPKERIDSPPFGPGTGMLLKPDIVSKAIEDHEAKKGKAYRIFFSPQGQKLDQRLLKKIAKNIEKKDHVILVAGRYEGMDERVETEYADIVLSIGDYVLMGGDLPAMVFLESWLRLIPAVVGKKESVEDDSFSGPFVDYPEYTEPVEWRGTTVPDIIRSGNHGAIEQWRTKKAVEKTVENHFDWLRTYPMSNNEKEVVSESIPPHYIVLMHDDIVLPNDRVGTTSVTSLDIHDAARSAKTYGIKNYFLVTPLRDQQEIVKTLLDFWQEGPGQSYNPERYAALKSVLLRSSFDEVVAEIEKKEDKKPIVMATSARDTDMKQIVSYHDQGLVWREKRPVLLVFGTGRGLAPTILEKCDYTLLPLIGLTEYNHLSVRSAIAVVLDRWLGIDPRP